MEKVLNQEEIDAMFRAASAGNSKAQRKEEVEAAICNFREAGHINAEQVRAISGLHEGFARNLTHWLAAYLRTAFECNLVSVEQLAYREVLARLPDITYIATIHLSPVDTLAALQLDLSVAFPIIDMLLGGAGESEVPLRDVTEIEEQIIEGVVRIICRELQSAWLPLGLEFAFDQRQQLSQMQRLMSPEEMTLSLSFEIRMSEAHGTLNLTFPSVISNALLRKLARDWAFQRPHATENGRNQVLERVKTCRFTAELGLLDLPLKTSELVALQLGQVLDLRCSTDNRPVLLVAGQRMYTAEPVRSGNVRAGRLQSRIPQKSSAVIGGVR